MIIIVNYILYSTIQFFNLTNSRT